MLLQNLRRNFHPPVQESLPNNRADIGIVVLGLGRKDLVAELAAESTFWPRRLQPSRDLSGIIRASAALIEAAVPLKPTVLEEHMNIEIKNVRFVR